MVTSLGADQKSIRMSDKSKIIFLWIATVIIIVAYMFWEVIFIFTGGDIELYNKTGDLKGGIAIYFPLQAFFMVMLCWYINYGLHKPISFVLLWLSIGNFIDELFFDNTTTKSIEIIFAGLVFIIGYRNLLYLVIKKLRFSRKD